MIRGACGAAAHGSVESGTNEANARKHSTWTRTLPLAVSLNGAVERSPCAGCCLDFAGPG